MRTRSVPHVLRVKNAKLPPEQVSEERESEAAPNLVMPASFQGERKRERKSTGERRRLSLSLVVRGALRNRVTTRRSLAYLIAGTRRGAFDSRSSMARLLENGHVRANGFTICSFARRIDRQVDENKFLG